MKITLSVVSNDLEESLLAIRNPVAEAATLAVRESGDQMKTEGRANIASAGFSSKWQNAWRVNYFPSRSNSINSVAYGRHKIFYSGIYETGGRISSTRGLLWLPIGDNVPKVGRRRATPRALIGRGVKLFTIKKDGGGPPILGAAVRDTKGAGTNKFSLSKLRSGTRGKRGEVRAVPLFYGLKSVQVRKKFDLTGVAARAQSQIAGRYASHINRLNPGG